MKQYIFSADSSSYFANERINERIMFEWFRMSGDTHFSFLMFVLVLSIFAQNDFEYLLNQNVNHNNLH